MAVTDEAADPFRAPPGLARRKFFDRSFTVWGILATMLGLVVLAALVFDLLHTGLPKLDLRFLTSFPASSAAEAGILSAWVGSLLVIFTTAAIAIPVGVMAGVYLEEYAGKNPVTSVIEVTVNNLAGVPSIIYGLLALGLFVYGLGANSAMFGQTILTSGLTLALLVLPVVIVATREAVRAVPAGIREAALSIGASKWQATSHHVVPYATPGIITGVIIALSRAIGETAPLILVGALTFVAFLPFVTPGEVGHAYYDAAGNESTITTTDMFLSWLPWAPDGQGWLSQSFTVLPIQMFNWTSRPEKEFLENAAAAGAVLLFVTLLLNGFAIWLRYNLRKNIRW
ncbi:MAG: phosphate ABC transporter permease PstA [Hyphomonadaceae bacterium]|nr:phosphate ABC transporter permease PstA [Hyphomonadaceae bacterium]